jgi:myo-inositol-1(or 4)-monophosphatase
MPDNLRFLATAIDVVLRAGEIQMARFGRDVGVRKKGAIDLVTEVDLEVEGMFRRTIGARYPTHEILAEELGASSGTGSRPAGGEDHRYCWVFDPIDGTTNFAHGIPIFCAALGLEIDGRIDVAAVYDPTRRELFTAERGLGAYLNGSRLAVSATVSVLDSVLVTGFPYDVHTNGGEILAMFNAFVLKARAVRRLGSAALDLCYVAAGRFDGFWEQRLKPWDVAGASLIVEEAGGTLSGMDGRVFGAREGHVLASNGPVHAEMLDIIATCRPGRA